MSHLTAVAAFGMIFPLIPLFAKSLNATPVQIGLLAAVFSMGQFFFAPFFGRLSDRFGRKPILMTSITVSAISFLVLLLTDSLWVLIFSRLLDGMSSAANLPVAQSYIADVTTKEERTKYIARVSAVFSSGFVFGPVFGGVMGSFGFNTAFLAAAGLSLINLIFVAIFLKESIAKKAEKLIIREGLFNIKAIMHGIRGDFRALFMLLALWAFYTSNFQLAIPLFTQEKFSLGVLGNGIFISMVGVIGALVQWFVLPRITKKIGEIKTIAIGMILMIIGLILAPFGPTIVVFAMLFAISNVGSSLTRPAINGFLSKHTKEGQGTTLGLGFSFGSLGRLAGPLIAGIAMGWWGVGSAFWITAFLLFIGLLVFWKVEIRGKNPGLNR